jgi:hypothetical protein
LRNEFWHPAAKQSSSFYDSVSKVLYPLQNTSTLVSSLDGRASFDTIEVSRLTGMSPKTIRKYAALDTSQVHFNRLESVPAGGLNEKNWKRGGNRWATPIAGQETDKARLADRTERCLVMHSLLVHPRPNVEPSSPHIRLKFLDIVTAHGRFIITHGLSGIPKCPKRQTVARIRIAQAIVRDLQLECVQQLIVEPLQSRL